MSDADDIKRLQKALKSLRNFPHNTTPASRHLELMADVLSNADDYPMFREEPQHCAITIYSVLIDLYMAKSLVAAKS